MKKYLITESRSVIQKWYYEVEAESEIEALDKILNAEVEATKSEIDYPNQFDDESYFDIEEEK